MKKPKLFAWCDFLVPTGFGNVAHKLLDDLHTQFDVSVLGINFYGDKPYDTDKYYVYPVQQPDWVGIEKAKGILENESFDVFFLFQDPYYIDQFFARYYSSHMAGKKIVIYFPLDGTPWNKTWTKIMAPAHHTFIYSKFCEKVISESIRDFSRVPHSILYHGVDFDVFKPLPDKEIQEFKEKKGIKDKFVIMNHNRYQPRKNWPATIRASALFITGYHKCSCGNWYVQSLKSCDVCGGSAMEIVESVSGHSDAALYCHCNPVDEMMGGRYFPASLFGMLANNGFGDTHMKNNNIVVNDGELYQASRHIPVEEINRIINAADVGLTTTFGEGFGLTLIENMAAGTTNIAPYNTTIPEIVGKTGHICKNIATTGFAGNNSQTSPLVDVREIVKALDREYNKWIRNGKKKVINEAGITRAKELFQWKDKKEHFTNKLLEVLKS